MQKTDAQKLVQETLQGSFKKERFIYLVKNILNHVEEAHFTYKGNFIFDDFTDSIRLVERVGKYKGPDEKLIDILVVHLQKDTSLERARTKQRNFVAKYLKGSRGGVLKDAALVAFVAPNGNDWRFSLVKMEYKFNEKGKVEEEFTPARRYSFLVGKNENSHTAQSRLLPVLLDDEGDPTLEELEDVFSIERVTKEFFEKYRDIFLRLKESLDDIVKKDAKVKADFKTKNIDTVDFAKKLLGQIVFLYFLQKKGWFAVKRGEEWGSGSKHFLRELFEKKHGEFKNFFNDILEPLFYEALRLERSGDYYSRFNCRIPFLNGGLFDPINDYDWWKTDILLPDDIFSNDRKTKEGDTGNGILDIFDRYNFTVKEDEPLEKEVAIDPEMLGKVFENLLEVKDRKSKGTYYTPREIVHYMCQESLANYLAIELEGKVSKDDIETLIKYGETVIEHDSRVVNEGRETDRYAFKLPQSVRKHAKLIDEKLAAIRVCDPAVGSGAFPVGMMNEIIRTRNALTPYIGENGERSPYHFKRQAIQNCLYGVDIDPGAVEIAKLRLWLSLVVDEEERETIQPLPNLDYKIVQGNSLLSVEKNLFNQQLFNKLEELKPLYFNETSASKKQEYRKQIDDLISQITNGHKDFDFEVYFSEVFHEKKGFDVVIGNPPWGGTLSEKEKSYFKKHFAAGKGIIDTYALFTEKGIRLLRVGGMFSFILPDIILLKNYPNIRKFILENTKILVIAHWGQAFEAASIDTTSLILKRTVEVSDKYSVHVLRDFEQDDIQSGVSLQIPAKYFWDETDYRFNLYLDQDTYALRKKLEEESGLLSNYLEVHEGIHSGNIRTKLFPEKRCSSACKPLIFGRGEIGRYYLKWEGKYVDYRLDIIDRSKKEYANLGRKEFFEVPKLLIRRTGDRIVAAFDDNNYYCSNNLFVGLQKSQTIGLYYFLGLLNSNLMTWYFRAIQPRVGRLFAELKINHLNQFPIRIISPKEQKPFTDLVDKILAITKDDDYLENPAKQTKVREYEKQIDQLVYKLYGLTAGEIKIVENTQS